jgi:hypothetical protein
VLEVHILTPQPRQLGAADPGVQEGAQDGRIVALVVGGIPERWTNSPNCSTALP